MKNLIIKLEILGISFFLFLLSSCSKNDTESESSVLKINKTSDIQINLENQNFIREDLKKFFKGQKYKICNLSDSINLNQEKLIGSINDTTGVTTPPVITPPVTPPSSIFGPFNYSLSNNGIIQENAKVVLNNTTNYSYGVYFCHIGRYSANIVLPNNTTGWIKPNSFTNQLYLNYSNQSFGYAYNITVSPTGQTTMNIATYYLKVNYNILGQWLGGNIIPNIYGTPALQYFYMGI